MYEISKNKCIGCGTCLKVCPEGIEIVKGRARIKNKDAKCLKNAALVCPQKAIRDIKRELVFAIGTDDGKNIKQDDHVGMSQYFSIWKYSGGSLKFMGMRENTKYQEDESVIHGDPEKAKKVTSVLKGVDAIVGGMIGPNIVRMKLKYVPIIVREPLIERALKMIKEDIIEIVEEYEKEGEKRKGIVLN